MELGMAKQELIWMVVMRILLLEVVVLGVHLHNQTFLERLCLLQITLWY